LTPKAAKFPRIRGRFTPNWVPIPGLNWRQLLPYRLLGTVATPRLLHFLGLREIDMLGQIARWGHNVLITTMALLTIAMVISLIR
jgi:hypothetical protein